MEPDCNSELPSVNSDARNIITNTKVSSNLVINKVNTNTNSNNLIHNSNLFLNNSSTNNRTDNNLSIFYYNCSGMCSKSKPFYLGVLECNYNIILLAETWLTKDFNSSEFFPSDFCVFRRDRYSCGTNLKGGGVLIAVRKNLFCELLVSDPKFEFLAVKLKLASYNLIICVMYIPGNSGPSVITEILANFTINVLPLWDEKTDLMVFGDFNFPELSWKLGGDDDNLFIPFNTNDSSALVCDYMANCGATQINNIPNSRGTFLDLCFYTNKRTYKIEACDDIAGYTSIFHTPMSIDLSYEFCDNLNFTKNILVFDYSRADVSSMNKFLIDVNWCKVLSDINVDHAVHFFNDLLYSCINKFVPKVKKKQSLARKDPWFTKDLKKLEVQRNRAHTKFKKSGSWFHHSQFKLFRKQFNCLNRFLYNNYIIDLEDDLRSNPKKFWKFVKLKNQTNGLPSAMTFKGQKSNDPLTICNFFAEYFSCVFVKDTNNIQWSSASINSSIITFSQQDVVNALLNLDSSKCAGPDGLPPALLRCCAAGLSAPLHLLFNKSLSQGKFPDVWKLAFLTPIHKNGSRNDVTNYRGIAIMSCIPKVFECMVKEVLFFHSKQLISSHQHGFFPGRSTVTNLALFQNYITKSAISKVQVDVVYTDFAKAFDKLNHRLLLDKLSKLNCDFIPLNWLSSYLTNRKMYVKIDDISSDSFTVFSGVPQGSHLGPLLFLLFINDVTKLLEFAECLLFADDIKFYSTITCEADRFRFQQDLNCFCDWADRNLMFLNVEKCQVMTISKSKQPLIFEYSLTHKILKRVVSVNDLGVVFSFDSTFNFHIDAIINKAYSKLGFIKRYSKDFHDLLTFKSLYSSFVRSHIEYASVIWSPFYDIHTKRIEGIQKQFLLFSLRKLPSTGRGDFKLLPYHDRCCLLGIQSLSSRRKCASATFARDILCGKVDCPELLSLFNIYTPQRALRPRNLLFIPTACTNYAYYDPVARIQRDLNSVSMWFDFNISRDAFKKSISALSL